MTLPWPWRASDLCPSGFFALRSPLLAFDELLAWGEGLEAPDALYEPERLAEAEERDRARLRSRLATAFARPGPREAVFLASPDLEQAIEIWRHDPDTGRGPGIERAMVRYFVRMASRPTPFGLFGGCSVGIIGRDTSLEIGAREQYRRRTSLDMEYLTSLLGALTAALLADPSARDRLAYAPPATSLYRAAGTVRYVESRAEGAVRSRHLVAVPERPHLRATLDRAAGGATRPGLVAALAGDGVAPDTAAEYVDRMIDHQLLVPRLDLTVTGPDTLSRLIEQLGGQPPTASAAARLEAVDGALCELDAAGMGGPPAGYREIARALAELGTPVDLGRLFRVELVKPAPEATLGMPVVEEIRRGVAILHRLTRRRPRPDLDRFRQDFERRYRDREMPLMEVLDSDLGIGFGDGGRAEPLLEGLSFPPESGVAPEWGRREEVLLRKLSGLTPADREITLDSGDLDEMAEAAPPPLPAALSVLATVAASSRQAVKRGDFQVVLEQAGGPSGAWLLGRFCHADPELLGHVERHLAAEEAHDPDAAWAEIVHLPMGKFANVVVRPVLRPFEITYLGASGAPPERQIPVSDLYLSLRDGRFALRSKRLDRRVVPRLTSAHDFTRSDVPAYRFLCALQVAEGVGGVTWSWGALGSAPFLPRVRMGRLVLARARWRLGREERRSLPGAGDAGLFRGVASWRAGLGLPRRVSLVDGDRTLLVDFDNVLSVASFADLVAGRDTVVLEEFFPGPDQLCVRGPEGAFVHELVVPFVARLEHHDERGGPAAGGAPEVLPLFAPGSEWLDAKVYAPASVIDTILGDVIAGLLARGRAGGFIDGWHFVRDWDPDGHLRVRFHGRGPELRGGVRAALEDSLFPYLADGRAWRLQLDTYQRDVERYGGPHGILLAERIFSADSDAALEMIGRLAPGDAGAEQRWRLAVVAADVLVDDLGLGDADRLGCLRGRRESLARQLGLDGRLEGQLSRLFRRQRASLETWADAYRGGHQTAAPVAPARAAILEALRARSGLVSPAAAELWDLERYGHLSATRRDLAGRFVDTCLNRWLRSADRRQELVVSDFLVRLQLSRSARSSSRE